MNPPSTLTELVESVAKEYNPESAVAVRDTISELNGTYHVTLEWAFPKGIPLFPYADGAETMWLTDERERKVSVNFESFEENTDYISMFKDEDKHKITLLSFDESIDKRGLKALQTAFSEIRLDADDLIEFVTGEPNRVNHVEIAGYTTGTGKLIKSAVDQLSDDEHTYTNAQTRDVTIWMLIVLNGGHRMIDNMWSKNRFNHVESLSINGESYPIEIQTIRFGTEIEADLGGRGQWIHTSDFMAEEVDNPPTPKLHIDELLYDIDFAELLHGESPWPDGPGVTPYCR